MRTIIIFILLIGLIIGSLKTEPIEDTIDVIGGATNTTYSGTIDSIGGATQFYVDELDDELENEDSIVE